MSFRALGDVSGINFSQINRMLAGEKVVTLDEFAVLCEALGLDPVQVLREAEAAVAARERSQPAVQPADDDAVLPPVWELAASRHGGWEAERREREGLPAVEPEDESQVPTDDVDD